MRKFAVSACRIFRPNSEHPPEGLFTELPRRCIPGNPLDLFIQRRA